MSGLLYKAGKLWYRVGELLFGADECCCEELDQACCLPDGTCIDTPAADCYLAGGIPQGEGTTCATTDCPDPDPTQACCFVDQSCQDLLPDVCLALGGDPMGEGTNCATTVCPSGLVTCCTGDYMNGECPSCQLASISECTALGGWRPYGNPATCIETDYICDYWYWLDSCECPTMPGGQTNIFIRVCTVMPISAFEDWGVVEYDGTCYIINEHYPQAGFPQGPWATTYLNQYVSGWVGIDLDDCDGMYDWCFSAPSNCCPGY
jgi:hypothetical protein